MTQADVGEGIGGRARVLLEHPDGGTAEVYAHGGQLLLWRHPDGDVLFLSANRDERQIQHGGVPIVFPQFGAGALPQHGFARTSEWVIGERGRRADRATVTLALRATPEHRALWPHDFRAELDVELGAALTTTLRVTNPGRDPFSFTAGFHTYLRVSDVAKVRLEGLRGTRYRDKVREWAEAVDDEPTVVARGELDRVYLDPPSSVTLHDASRAITVESSGFANLVVWSPGSVGDARFGFVAGEWRRFLCVEPATVTDPVVLGAGAVWEGRQTLAVGRPGER